MMSTSTNRRELSVTHVLESIGPEQGGTLTFTKDLYLALKNYGTEVKVAVIGFRDKTKKFSSDVDVDFTTQPSPTIKAIDSQELLRQSSIVHLHTPWCLRNIAIANFLRKNNVPYIVTMHGMLDRWSLKQKSLKKRIFLGLIGKRFLRSAETIHCTAEAEKIQVVECDNLLQQNVVVIPCLFNAQEYFPLFDLRTSENVPRILFLSRLHPKKGCEILIEAVRLLVNRGIVFTVSIVGPGDVSYVRSLKDRVIDLGLADIVTFSGMVSGEDKIEHYRRADIFVLPTYQENFGFVLVEAMASGMPVITTKNTDIWSELRSGGAEIVENTPEAFSSALEVLILDREARSNLGKQGMNHIANWLNYDRTVRCYNEMYRDAIRKYITRTHQSRPSLIADSNIP